MFVRNSVMVLAGVLTAFAGPGVAKPLLGEFTVMGLGNASCGTWIQARKSGNSVGYESWVMGYLTAYNQFTEHGDDVTAQTDHAGVLAAIDKHCADNPLETINQVSQMALADLMDRLSAKMDADMQKTIDGIVKGVRQK